MENPVAPYTVGVGLRMTLMAIHYAVLIAVLQMEFSYTRWMHLYRFLRANAVRIKLANYTIWEVP